MKLIHKEQIEIDANGRGLRVLGYLEKDGTTVAMFIVEAFHGCMEASINLVIGDWGRCAMGSGSRVAVFATFQFGKECGYFFNDPGQQQAQAYKRVASSMLSRDEALTSPDVGLYKESLDVIYENVLRSFPQFRGGQ